MWVGVVLSGVGSLGSGGVSGLVWREVWREVRRAGWGCSGFDRGERKGCQVFLCGWAVFIGLAGGGVVKVEEVNESIIGE